MELGGWGQGMGAGFGGEAGHGGEEGHEQQHSGGGGGEVDSTRITTLSGILSTSTHAFYPSPPDTSN